MCLSGWYIWLSIQTSLVYVSLESLFITSSPLLSFLVSCGNLFGEEALRPDFSSLFLMSSVVIEKSSNLIDVRELDGWRSEGWFFQLLPGLGKGFHFLSTFAHCPSLEWSISAVILIPGLQVEPVMPALCSVFLGRLWQGWDFKK